MVAEVIFRELPWGVWLVEKSQLCSATPTRLRVKRYKLLVFFLTFCCYTCYHLSRKPFSVVKISLCPLCANCSVACTLENDTERDGEVCMLDNDTERNFASGWPPFNDENHGKTLLGGLDYSWLFTYAIVLYFSGYLADRLNLRLFLTIGMLGSSISVILLGLAYFSGIHSLPYFIIVQIFGGALQSTGWPGVVAVMSHWFGKHNRGLIMGIWNSHISMGNILGTIIPSFWADCDAEQSPWGWSFFIPGFITIFFAIVVYLFLVTDPVHVGLPPPQHHKDQQIIVPHSTLEEGANDSMELESVPTVNPKPINFFKALLIPGVVEYALALFFNKLVSYTFLFWLPLYVKLTHPELSGPQSDWLSAFFDVGGIIGGIIAGLVSDLLDARAFICVTMLLLAVPMLPILQFVRVSLGWFVVLLIINGALVNGPYAIITTAVSSDLGTHPSLKASTNAKATVAAIIDGTGSMGAAVGPLLVGLISDYLSWTGVFYFLMICCFVAAVMLIRLLVKEVTRLYSRFKSRRSNGGHQDPIELQRLRPLSDEEDSYL